jgi:hypothetical protein
MNILVILLVIPLMSLLGFTLSVKKENSQGNSRFSELQHLYAIRTIISKALDIECTANLTKAKENYDDFFENTVKNEFTNKVTEIVQQYERGSISFDAFYNQLSDLKKHMHEMSFRDENPISERSEDVLTY